MATNNIDLKADIEAKKKQQMNCSFKKLNGKSCESINLVVQSSPVSDAIIIPEFNEIVVLTKTESKLLKVEVKKFDKYIKSVDSAFESKDPDAIRDAKHKFAKQMAKEAKKAAKTAQAGKGKKSTATSKKPAEPLLILSFIEIIELGSAKHSYVPLNLIDSFRKSGRKKALKLTALATGSANPITAAAEKSDSSTKTVNGKVVVPDSVLVPKKELTEKPVSRFAETTIKAEASYDLLGPNNKPINTQVKLQAILEWTGLTEEDSLGFAVKWAKTFDTWVEKTNGGLQWTYQDRKKRQDALILILDPKTTPGQRSNQVLKDETILTDLKSEVNAIWGGYRDITILPSDYIVPNYIKRIDKLNATTWKEFAKNLETLEKSIKEWREISQGWATPSEYQQEMNGKAGGNALQTKVEVSRKRKKAFYTTLVEQETVVKKSRKEVLEAAKANNKEIVLFQETALGHVKNEVDYIWSGNDDDFVTKIKSLEWEDFSESDEKLIENRILTKDLIKNKALPSYMLNASAQAQFMRFTAGHSLKTNFDLATGRVGLKGEAKVDMALVEGKLNGQLYIPSDKGMDLSIQSTTRYEAITWNPSDIINARIHSFGLDKTFLNDTTLRQLSEAMISKGWQAKLNNNKMQVIGHACPIGGADYNLDLSKRRAKVAYEFLTFDHNAWMQRFEDATWGDKEILKMAQYVVDKKEPGRLRDTNWSKIIDSELYPLVNDVQYLRSPDYLGVDPSCTVSLPVINSVSGTVDRTKTKNQLGTRTEKQSDYLLLLIKAYMKKATRNQFFLKTAFIDPAHTGKGESQLLTKNPSEYNKNRRIELQLLDPVSSGTKTKTATISLGEMRVQCEVYLTGYAGANAMIAADLGFGGHEKAEQAIEMQGLAKGDGEKVGKKEKDSGTQTTVNKSNTATSKSTSAQKGTNDAISIADGLDTSVSAFAGATATAGIKGILEWKCPSPELTLKEPNIVVPTVTCAAPKAAAKVIKEGHIKNKFTELASMGYSISASAGIGLSGNFQLGFDFTKGVFIIKAAASVTYGVGAGGGFEFAVGIKNAYWFILFVHAQLNDHNFSYLDFFDEQVFDLFSAMQFELFVAGYMDTGDVVMDIGEKVQEILGGIKKLLRMWKDATAPKTLAADIAKRLTEGNAMISVLTPDVKARMIYVLVNGGEWYSRDVELEHAILKILNTLSSKIEFQEILERMSGKIPDIDEKYVGTIAGEYTGKIVNKEMRNKIKAKHREASREKLLTTLNNSETNKQYLAWQKNLPDVAPKMKSA